MNRAPFDIVGHNPWWNDRGGKRWKQKLHTALKAWVLCLAPISYASGATRNRIRAKRLRHWGRS